jgi:PAS domain S-box-containing protein
MNGRRNEFQAAERKSIKIVLVYALVAGLYILFSDSLVTMIFPDPEIIRRISIFKGLTFVAVTAALLYWQIRGYVLELQRGNEDLDRSRQRMENILASISDGFLALDSGWRFTFLNDRASAMLGCVGEDLLGKCIWEEVAGLEGSEFDRECRRAAAAGKPSTFEASLPRDNGSYSVHVSPYPDGISVYLSDIGERRRTEEAMARVLKLESVGLLAGGIAHDFNNLLTAILGNLELARHRTPRGSDTADLLRDAENATFRARDLTHRLLTFARGGAPVRKAADIRELVRESALLMQSGSRARCDIRIADDIWAVDVDAGQILQVLNNLILNGIQAMPAGGTLRIFARNLTVRREEPLPLHPGRYVLLTVADEGAGISQDDLRKVFDPYFTTKASGSGLGLTISHSIVRRHGGHIEISSEPARGTTVFVYVPASRDRVEATNASDGGAARGSGRILLMDDEEMVRKIGAAMLRELGYTVETASGGREAVERYRSAAEAGAPFAAVVVDLTVPGGMGGRECGEELLRLDADARVLVSSGYSNDPVMAEHARHGFRGTVAKPYRLEELGRAISEAIAR